MNSYSGLLQQALLFGFLIVALMSTMTAVTYPILKGRLQRLSPETQAGALLGICLLPLLAAGVVLFSALLPSLLQLVGLENDHCLGHTEGHQHFCLIHRPTVIDSQPVFLIASLFLMLPGAVLLRIVSDIFLSRRFSKILAQYPMLSMEGRVCILATSSPLAFSTGFFKPVIHLSTGLLQSLSEEEKDLVMVHEKTHLVRRDSLRYLMARAFSLAHFPLVRRALLTHLCLASEQLCDAAAARKATDTSKMAELLLKVERIYQHHFPVQTPVAFSLAGTSPSTLPERIRALLGPQREPHMRWAVPICVSLALVLLLVGHDVLHDWLEHLLTLSPHG